MSVTTKEIIEYLSCEEMESTPGTYQIYRNGRIHKNL